MRLQYCPIENQHYIEIKKSKYDKSVTHDNGNVILDYDKKGNLIGIEILSKMDISICIKHKVKT